jgi:septum formation protein
MGSLRAERGDTGAVARTLAAEVSAYVALGEGIGKAGGYAIQGKAALFVERIEGDYTNVVGLPLALTGRMLEGYGVRWY